LVLISQNLKYKCNGQTYIPLAYFLKVRTVKPEKHPLLENGSETTSISRQWPQNKRYEQPLLGSHQQANGLAE
jgi:hypothetical protein